MCNQPPPILINQADAAREMPAHAGADDYNTRAAEEVQTPATAASTTSLRNRLVRGFSRVASRSRSAEEELTEVTDMYSTSDE